VLAYGHLRRSSEPVKRIPEILVATFPSRERGFSFVVKRFTTKMAPELRFKDFPQLFARPLSLSWTAWGLVVETPGRRPRLRGLDDQTPATRATSTLGLGSLGIVISIIDHRTCASVLASLGAPNEVRLARRMARKNHRSPAEPHFHATMSGVRHAVMRQEVSFCLAAPRPRQSTLLRGATSPRIRIAKKPGVLRPKFIIGPATLDVLGFAAFGGVGRVLAPDEVCAWVSRTGRGSGWGDGAMGSSSTRESKAFPPPTPALPRTGRGRRNSLSCNELRLVIAGLDPGADGACVVVDGHNLLGVDPVADLRRGDPDAGPVDQYQVLSSDLYELTGLVLRGIGGVEAGQPGQVAVPAAVDPPRRLPGAAGIAVEAVDKDDVARAAGIVAARDLDQLAHLRPPPRRAPLDRYV